MRCAIAMTSLPRTVAAAERLLVIARAEWGIDHGLHYRRDVTLQEDASQLRRGDGPQVLAALNNGVLMVMDHRGVTNVPAQMREFAAQPLTALALLLGRHDD